MAIKNSTTSESTSSPKPVSTFAALVRGINVGGKNKVEMAKLKLTFERLGCSGVKTLIASGNVVFCSDVTDQLVLAKKIESEIEADFGISVRVVLRDLPSMAALVNEIPPTWNNDTETKCDVMFLLPEVDNENVLQQLSFNPAIEDVRYVPGAILWHIERNKATKSRMFKIASTPLYRQMTIRNPNTVRRLHELMLQLESGKDSSK